MLDHIRRVITDHYETVFPTVYGSSVPTQFENLPFVPPVNAVHARLYINETAANRASIGTHRKFIARTGFVFVEIYAPKDRGTQELNLVAEAVMKVLNSRTLITPDGCSVMLEVPRVLATGTSNQDGYYWKTVMTRYRVR